MTYARGKEQLADELLGRLENDAIRTLLTRYETDKSLAEQDAETVLEQLRRSHGYDVAAEYKLARQKVRAAILGLLELIGA
jgi:hypothetical protein